MVGVGLDGLVRDIQTRLELPTQMNLEQSSVERTIRGGVKVFYQQYANDLPVFDHGLFFSAFQYPEGAPVLYSEDGRWAQYSISDINPETTPFIVDRIMSRVATKIRVLNNLVLTSEEAALIASAESRNISLSRPVLGLHGSEPEGFLKVYKVVSYSVEQRFQVTIDAQSGKVISSSVVASGVQSGQPRFTVEATPKSPLPRSGCTHLMFGAVYRNAPTIDSDSTRSGLLYLCDAVGGVYKLDGKFGEVLNDGGAEVEAEFDEDFTYVTTTADFDQVQAYFHMTTFNQWMEQNYQSYYFYAHEELDYTIPSLTFHVNVGDDGPHIVGSSSTINFGRNDTASVGTPYWTHEGAVIAHEMAHIHQYELNSQLLNGSSSTAENLAISEGLADYWGIFYRKSLYPPSQSETVMGDYVGDWVYATAYF